MQTGEIYKGSDAREQVRMESDGGFHGTLHPSQNNGWRVRLDGTLEEVAFYYGFGWLTSDELFDLRQRQPRTAP